MDLKLTNKVVLVTGGSKGIGKAIVECFLVEGARVANVNRSVEEGQQLAELAAARGQQCLFVQGDLTEVAACENAVRTVREHFGRIDILINNAGANDGVTLEAGPAAFNQSLTRNLLHYYAMAHFALADLKQSRGVIINVGSKVSVTGQGGTSGYAAAKGAVNSLTREWAVDLAPYGIRVNAVIPAETWTPLYEAGLATSPDPAAMKQKIAALVPLEHRFTTAEEIAHTVVFTASARASHTTGQILFVDGGYTHLDRKCTTDEFRVSATKS